MREEKYPPFSPGEADDEETNIDSCPISDNLPIDFQEKVDHSLSTVKKDEAIYSCDLCRRGSAKFNLVSFLKVCFSRTESSQISH